MQPYLRNLLPLFMLFFFFSISAFFLSDFLNRNQIDTGVLHGANVLFLMISVISFFIQRRGMLNKNPHVFVRSVTAGMMVKMLFCIVAVIGYVYASGVNFNKRGVFISLFLYLAYLSIEVFVVMRMNKKYNA